jgi:predicted solute-binding protein
MIKKVPAGSIPVIKHILRKSMKAAWKHRLEILDLVLRIADKWK